MDGIQELLQFWFDDETRPSWSEPTPAFDQSVRKRFAELFARAATGGLEEWQASAEGALALCILLDQIPRCMFRGDRRAFDTDAAALAVAEQALRRGWDREMSADRQRFLYYPFSHSEELSNQLRALALFEAQGQPQASQRAKESLAVIRRFGRFPERNVILGRPNTAEEEAYLQERVAASTVDGHPPKVVIGEFRARS
jgi:uncharacterized protein (DUF924 family)